MYQTTIQYGEFVLQCTPTRTTDGKTAPHIVITDSTGQVLVERSFPSQESFNSEAAAVAFSRAWGRWWVDCRDAS